jgi:hypothetical protein
MASRAERKLSAILAADVVGHSRLVAADEGYGCPPKGAVKGDHRAAH